MNDPTVRLAVGSGLLVLAVLLRGWSLNRLVRRKLRLSIYLLLVCVAFALALREGLVSPKDFDGNLQAISELLFALAGINLAVVVLINPLRVDRIPERFPNIVQDTIVISLFLLVATLVMQEKLLTTSAVGAVVIGFALQDTLGNTFAGLAIQVEKPFRIGNWVVV
jgi:small-conductance mechanosensitive channel